MIKTQSDVRQEPVLLKKIGNQTYVYLCLNETEVDEESHHYEYDYNEFYFEDEALDVDQITTYPELYLNYETGMEVPTFDAYKNQRVQQTRELLQQYLIEHPIFSHAKYEEGRYYKVTDEKQRQLTSKLAIAEMYARSGIPYDAKWNDTGNICEKWSIQELSQLAMEIDAYITPLVTQQQTYERQILSAKSVSEIEAIPIIYGHGGDE